VRAAKFLGYVIMAFSLAGAVFYTAWWAGYIPTLDPEDAVRLTSLLISLAFFLATGFIGYVMAATKPPR